MKNIWFIFGLLNWFAFAYDIENDRDFMTWIWLLTSLLFFANYYSYKDENSR